MTNLIISALNPGYKIDGVSDVGELIELQNLTDAPLSLAGFSLRYTNGSGNSSIIVEFPEGSLITGEKLLLTYYKSPDAERADLTYKTSLALAAGPLELLYRDEVVDTVCWNGKGDCNKAFKSASPTTLVRDLAITGQEPDPDTGPGTNPSIDPTKIPFVPVDNYQPIFATTDSPHLILPPEPAQPETPTPENPNDEGLVSDAQTPSLCSKLTFTEILTYYTQGAEEQFIELYNTSDVDIDLSTCKLRYKKKTYPLSGIVPADGFFAYYPKSAFTFTKNPSTSNSVELLDGNGESIDELVYSHGQKKSTSYAMFLDPTGSETWATTYYPSPGTTNVYQEYRTCPAGKVINAETGNCINEPKTTVLAACPAGKYRNPVTGRCKNLATTASELQPCAEGYERNPETNRCRKITTTNTGADYAVVPTTESDHSTFVALGIVICLVSVGAIYIILQFRHEIVRAARKIRQRFHHFTKDFLARKISWHRDKQP